MATNVSDLAPGAEPQDDETTDPNAAPPVEAGEGGEEEAEPVSVEDLARQTGWVPKEEYSGPPEAWKPAAQFILDGREIQRETARELKNLRSTVDTISRTTGTIIEQEVGRRVEELTNQYNQAVDDGDAQKAFRIANEIGALKSGPAPARTGPPPDAAEFAERHASWFQKDALATTLAVETTNRLAAMGYDTATQLREAEKEVRRVYPHLFGQQRNGVKPAPGVNQPSGRGPAPKSGPKGYADLPPEAKRVADDLAERGVIKADNPQAAKEAYAQNYWKTQGAKA